MYPCSSIASLLLQIVQSGRPGGNMVAAGLQAHGVVHHAVLCCMLTSIYVEVTSICDPSHADVRCSVDACTAVLHSHFAYVGVQTGVMLELQCAGEIDRVLKRVDEGVLEFDSIWEKVLYTVHERVQVHTRRH